MASKLWNARTLLGYLATQNKTWRRDKKSFLIFYVYELERIHHMPFWVKLYHIELVNLHMMQIAD